MPMSIQPPPDLEIKVLTPDVTEEMNSKVARGEILPYTYFSYSEQDYISFGQWIQDALRYIREQNRLLKYYREEAYSNVRTK